MIFQREGCKPIDHPSAKQLERELKRMKSSYGNLTFADGSYAQVAGGPGLFLIEYRNAFGIHHRGRQPTPVVTFPEGTELMFSGGSIKLARSEWFLARQVQDVLESLCAGGPPPEFLAWLPLNESFQKVGQ